MRYWAGIGVVDKTTGYATIFAHRSRESNQIIFVINIDIADTNNLPPDRSSNFFGVLLAQVPTMRVRLVSQRAHHRGRFGIRIRQGCECRLTTAGTRAATNLIHATKFKDWLQVCQLLSGSTPGSILSIERMKPAWRNDEICSSVLS